MLTTLEPLPFSRDVLDAYVTTLAQAYELNGDRIDPDLGHNEGAFRYLVYQTTNYLLPGNVRRLGVDLEQDNNTLVLRQNGNKLRAYPIGRSEQDDPWTSFPTNRHGAPAAAAENGQLELFARDEIAGAAANPGTNYILGHCGTSVTGLRAVHLCLPVGFSYDATIRRWVWVRTIYRADTDQLPLTVGPVGPSPVAPPEVAAPPQVAIRERDMPAIDVE